MPVGRSVDQPQISIGPPSINRLVKAPVGIGAVAQVPPDETVELRFHYLAQAVGIIKPVDKARRLPPLGARVAVVFCANQLNVRASRTKIITDLPTQIRRICCPVD